MPIVTKRSLFLLGGLAIGGVGVAGFIWSGAYNVGADDPHIAPVYALMETIRDQSVSLASRAAAWAAAISAWMV